MKSKRIGIGILLIMISILSIAAMSKGFAESTEPLLLKIAAEVELMQNNYTLADLGTMNGGTEAERAALRDIRLGTVPLPGQERILSKEYLESLLRSRGFRRLPRLQMGERVVVRTASLKINATELKQVISEKFQALPTLAEQRDLELSNLPEAVWLSKGEYQTEVEVVGTSPEVGKILFRVSFIRGKETLRILHINGKIHAVGMVWRVKENLPRHTKLTKDCFEQIKQDLKNGDEYLGEVEGYRNVGQLRSGDILKKRQLQTLPMVNKNTIVTVTVRDGTVTIQLQAQAQSDGWFGDYIRLQNLESKKWFSGQVSGENAVEVLSK